MFRIRSRKGTLWCPIFWNTPHDFKIFNVIGPTSLSITFGRTNSVFFPKPVFSYAIFMLYFIGFGVRFPTGYLFVWALFPYHILLRKIMAINVLRRRLLLL